MSVAELKQAKNEKLYELGFLYYNKAVEGMDIMPEALEIINDIRSRFGYLLYLKQSDPQNAQIAQLDEQISADFSRLGEVCYGYYNNGVDLDNNLKSVCSFIASVDAQMLKGDVIAEQISMSANELQNDLPSDVAHSETEGTELNDSDFVMPAPEVSAEQDDNGDSDESLFENIDTSEIENISRSVVCSCGFENVAGSKFCSSCGNKLVD